MKSLTKLYNKLTHTERFRLTLDALARDDEVEAERLAGTCPHGVYKMKDTDFTGLLEGSLKVILVFNCLWSEAYYGYIIADQSLKYHLESLQGVIKHYVTGANQNWNESNNRKPPFDIEGREPTEKEINEIALMGALEKIPNSILDHFYWTVGHVKGVYEGFYEFCSQINIQPEILVTSWYAPLMDQLKTIEALLDGDIEINQESKEVTMKVLSQYLNGTVYPEKERNNY